MILLEKLAFEGPVRVFTLPALRFLGQCKGHGPASTLPSTFPPLLHKRRRLPEIHGELDQVPIRIPEVRRSLPPGAILGRADESHSAAA